MRPATPSAEQEDGAEHKPSKTQLKQRMHELQELGHQLTELSAETMQTLQLPERLRDAIHEFKRTRSHEGRRRQLQFIGKLMRGIDAEPLQAAVAAHKLGPATQAMQLHEAERWRIELARDDEALQRWTDAHPDSDLPKLRALVLATRRDAQRPPEQRHGRAWRELFQFVKLALAER